MAVDRKKKKRGKKSQNNLGSPRKRLCFHLAAWIQPQTLRGSNQLGIEWKKIGILESQTIQFFFVFFFLLLGEIVREGGRIKSNLLGEGLSSGLSWIKH